MFYLLNIYMSAKNHRFFHSRRGQGVTTHTHTVGNKNLYVESFIGILWLHKKPIRRLLLSSTDIGRYLFPIQWFTPTPPVWWGKKFFCSTANLFISNGLLLFPYCCHHPCHHSNNNNNREGNCLHCLFVHVYLCLLRLCFV